MIIDSRFQSDHAGRGDLQVMVAPRYNENGEYDAIETEAIVKHEIAELREVIRYTVTHDINGKVVMNAPPYYSGIASPDTLLYGIEVKFYSSRIHLTNKLETEIPNLFTIGDGAGVTRGLVQASASGVVAAREIISRIANQ